MSKCQLAFKIHKALSVVLTLFKIEFISIRSFFSLALCTNLFLYSFFPLLSENLNKVTEQRIKMMIDSIEAFISLFLLLSFIFSRVKSFLTKNGMCWLIIKLNVSFLKYVINCMYIQCILCGMKTAHPHIHSTDMLLSRVNLIRMNNSLLFE